MSTLLAEELISQEDKGGFQLPRNVEALTLVKFPSINKIEAMSEVSRVNLKVERGSTFIFTRDTSYIASKFTQVKFTCVST